MGGYYENKYDKYEWLFSFIVVEFREEVNKTTSLKLTGRELIINLNSYKQGLGR
jgi:hypothetical protein